MCNCGTGSISQLAALCPSNTRSRISSISSGNIGRCKRRRQPVTARPCKHHGASADGKTTALGIEEPLRDRPFLIRGSSEQNASQRSFWSTKAITALTYRKPETVIGPSVQSWRSDNASAVSFTVSNIAFPARSEFQRCDFQDKISRLRCLHQKQRNSLFARMQLGRK